MQFDLVRGNSDVDKIVEAYRALTTAERAKKVKLPSVPKRERCEFLPKINSRKLGTLQHGTFTMKKNISSYGDTYFLVIRSSGQWASGPQSFAVAVMLRHSAKIKLYQRLRALLRVRT